MNKFAKLITLKNQQVLITKEQSMVPIDGIHNEGTYVTEHILRFRGGSDSGFGIDILASQDKWEIDALFEEYNENDCIALINKLRESFGEDEFPFEDDPNQLKLLLTDEMDETTGRETEPQLHVPLQDK